MRTRVEIVERDGAGPRVLFLPGLGARASGFEALAERLRLHCRPVLVNYPEGPFAAKGATGLAEEVARAAGPFDAAVASSFGGMVGAQLAHDGAVRGLAFIGAFTDPAQLGLRGRLLPLMAPIAEIGRPGAVAAAIAAHGRVARAQVAQVVPTTPIERRTVWHRALAIAREMPPPALGGLNLVCTALHGRRDWLVPVASLDRLAATLPPATPRHVLEGAGHVPYFTHPEACAERLLPWLQRMQGALARHAA